jgi:DNA-directed RNA polymerase subunit K/omega
MPDSITATLKGGVDSHVTVSGGADPVKLSGGADPLKLTIGGSAATPVGVAVTELPDVNIGGTDKPLKIAVTEIPEFKLNITNIPEFRLNVTNLPPLDLNISIKQVEVPRVRTHVPADFKLGLSLFGLEVICVRLCGEGQMITEPFVPNPCEIVDLPRVIKRIDDTAGSWRDET